jgi:exodeoxyribonuclease VII large subunit
LVSAVGHEIDFTISDFVADFRAATPSAAAEIISQGFFASRDFVAAAQDRLSGAVRAQFKAKQLQFSKLSQQLARSHPRRKLEQRIQRLDELHLVLGRYAKSQWRQAATRLSGLVNRLARTRPNQVLDARKQKLTMLHEMLGREALSRFQHLKVEFARTESKLKLLSPRNVLERGYSITFQREDGRVVRDSSELKHGDRIRTLLRSGSVESTVDTPPAP